MRDDWSELERYRLDVPGMESLPGDRFGCFRFPFNSRVLLMVIATSGAEDIGVAGEWEHVSVHGEHMHNRSWREFTPSWEMMDWIRVKFWKPSELVVQYHVPSSDHVNTHPHTLHLWRHREKEIIRPPKICV